MNVASLVENKKNPKIPPLSPGDTVKVHTRIVEGGKERIQVFQGVVIQVRSGGNGGSFTVRHVAFGIGVERTFPFVSPLVEKVEIVRHGKVRRSRLYYLRNLSGRQARRKIKRVERKVGAISEELAEAETVAEPEEIVGEEGEMVAAAPEATEAAAEPVAVEAVEEPKAEEPPVAEEKPAEEPKAEVPAETPEPVAEAAEEKPAAVAEPVAEEAVEEPKAEEAAAEPVAEAEAEKPAAEVEPAAEAEEEKPAEPEEDKS